MVSWRFIKQTALNEPPRNHPRHIFLLLPILTTATRGQTALFAQSSRSRRPLLSLRQSISSHSSTISLEKEGSVPLSLSREAKVQLFFNGKVKE